MGMDDEVDARENGSTEIGIYIGVNVIGTGWCLNV